MTARISTAWALCATLVLFCVAPPQRVLGGPNDLTQPGQVATNALATFIELQSPGRGSVLNDAENETLVDEVNTGKLKPQIGVPIECMGLSLDDVKTYGPGTNAASLLKPLSKVIFPVRAGGDILGGITVEKTKDEWAPAGYGAKAFVSDLCTASDETASARGSNTTPPFLVQMRSLNYKFLGFRTADGKVVLRPLTTDRSLDLSTNSNYSLETVLDHLEPLANAYNGLPR